MRGTGRQASGFLIVLVGLASAAMFGTMGLHRWRIRRSIRENEGAAQRALQGIADANFRFWKMDLDRNGVKDYWTGDVATLHEFGLIPLGVAQADAAPLKASGSAPIPYHGYFFKVLEKHELGGVAVRYKLDTDGTRRLVHHEWAFGVCAYPSDFGWSGRRTFIICEQSCIGAVDNGGKPVTESSCNQCLHSFYERMD